MTKLMQLQLRQSELRQKLAAQLDVAVEQRPESFVDDLDRLTREARSLETEVQAAILSEPEPETRAADPAGRELRSMIDRADVGNFFEAALARRAASGVEAELQAHYRLEGNQIPLALLETRAVTPAPTDVGTNQQAIIPAIFPASAAAFLGIPMPTVPVGESLYHVLTSGAVPQTPAKDAATNPTEDTGAFSSESLKGGRLQASFLYNREDRSRFEGLDAALRSNLSDAMQDALDKQIIQGTEGLLTGTNLPNNNVSAVTSYALYREQFAFGRVDGRYATSTGDLRVVVGSATYSHMAGQYRGNADNVDALQALAAAGVGVRVSAHVPALASTKQNAIIRLGSAMDMVAPIWEGITLLDDPYTESGKGQIRLTAYLLYAVKVLRADGFHKQQIQNA